MLTANKALLLLVLGLCYISSISADVHKTSSGVVCPKGNHKDNDVCVSNTDWCEEGAMDFSTGDCYDCKLYAWTTTSITQGRYCATHWWRWLLWILLALLILGIIAGIIGACRKKNIAKANRGYGEMHPTHQSL